MLAYIDASHVGAADRRFDGFALGDAVDAGALCGQNLAGRLRPPVQESGIEKLDTDCETVPSPSPRLAKTCQITQFMVESLYKCIPAAKIPSLECTKLGEHP